MKDLYKAFLQASSVRYSGLELSEVSPSSVSDSVRRWLKSRCFSPKELWQLVWPSVDRKAPCLLIADDTVLAKKRSKKIALVHYCQQQPKTDPQQQSKSDPLHFGFVH